MHKTRIAGKGVLVAAIAAGLLFLPGCQGQPAVEATSSASPSSHDFRGQNLPSKVDKLSGTPFYNSSVELAARAKVDGAPFLLIAPLEPTRALLMVEQGTTPAELTQRASEKGDFSGTTESIEAPQLVGFVKESTGLDLKTDEDGKVVVLKVERPAGATSSTAASASPAAGDTAPSTPSVESTPPPGGTPGATSTPAASATPGAKP